MREIQPGDGAHEDPESILDSLGEAASLPQKGFPK